jgi:signal peptidase I
MEGRLFFISIWCGLYGLILRQIFKTDRLSRQVWITMVLNSLFWATGAAMLGMLLSSYFEKLDEMGMYAFLFAVIGLVGGAASGYLKSKDATKRDELLKDNLEWADTGFSAILLASVVMFFIVQAFKIPSGSMRMTFIEGDHLFVNKFIYGIPVPFTEKKVVPFRKVQPKDIVIFRFPTEDKTSPHYGKDFIKRVVATAGQKVQVIDKAVYVDGVKQDEPYAQHVDNVVFPGLDKETLQRFQGLWEKGEYQGNEVRDNFGPIVVPPDHIMVMGDNRDRSYDSRFWGPLPLKQIKGKAWLLYWPVTRFRPVH